LFDFVVQNSVFDFVSQPLPNQTTNSDTPWWVMEILTPFPPEILTPFPWWEEILTPFPPEILTPFPLEILTPFPPKILALFLPSKKRRRRTVGGELILARPRTRSFDK
jgi:hypothetical protein